MKYMEHVSETLETILRDMERGYYREPMRSYECISGRVYTLWVGFHAATVMKGEARA